MVLHVDHRAHRLGGLAFGKKPQRVFHRAAHFIEVQQRTNLFLGDLNRHARLPSHFKTAGPRD